MLLKTSKTFPAFFDLLLSLRNREEIFKRLARLKKEFDPL